MENEKVVNEPVEMDFIQQVVEATKSEPIAVLDGVKIYTFAEAQKANSRKLYNEKMAGRKMPDFGAREEKDNGLGYTRSKGSVVAVNPKQFFANRAQKVQRYGVDVATGKEVEETIWEVVNDYRAIKDKDSGKVYTNTIQVYVIGREDGKVKILSQKTISDEEFVNGYKERLSTKAMLTIIGAIKEMQVSDGGSMESDLTF